jgi:alkylation response protein AidB-like acyl-CoA dehydrogenase
LITGEKKFITNAIWGDYFVVGARTDIGISLFLMEKGMPGLNTRRMNMQGSWASGTSYMTFEDVKVPAEYLIGKEGEGFKYIMYNFNGERWGGVVQTTRVARVCYEEAYRYANKRVTFGKKLIENDVIRSKLGRMASRIECCHAWAEQITYQLNTMPRMEANLKMPGTICLAKVEATQTLEMCAREASQIFGGLAYTRGSQGGRIERIYRDVRVLAIGGGSEEIVEDFAMRMMLKTSKL